MRFTGGVVVVVGTMTTLNPPNQWGGCVHLAGNNQSRPCNLYE